MSILIDQEAVQRAAEAYAAIRANEAAIEAERDKLRKIEDDLDDCKAERARKIEQEDADAALRLVDGEEAAAPNPQRLKRIATINGKIPALTAAIPLQRRRIAEAEESLPAAEVPFTRAVMEALIGIQRPAADRVRAALSEVEEAFVYLLAADQIQVATIGQTYAVPAGQAVPTLNGGAIRNVLKALPGRFRPDTLDFEALQSAARSIADVTIKQIKEPKS